MGMGDANQLECVGIHRAYNHSLDLSIAIVSEYLSTYNSKPRLICSCPLIFQWHSCETIHVKTNYIH